MLAKFKATMSGYIKTIQGHELEIEDGSEYEVRFNGPVILINDYIYMEQIFYYLQVQVYLIMAVYLK